MDLVLDSMHVHNVHEQMVKILFLELIIVFLCIDNKKRNLNSCLRFKRGIYDTTITAEAKYPINFTRSRRRFVLCLYYNKNSSFSYVNPVGMYKFKEKELEIKLYPLCLGNILFDLIT